MISRIICFLLIPSSLSTQGVNDYKIVRDQWNAEMERYHKLLKYLENSWSHVLGQGKIIMEPMGRENPIGHERIYDSNNQQVIDSNTKEKKRGPQNVPVYEYNLIDEDPQNRPGAKFMPGDKPTDPFRTKNWGNPGLHRMRQPHFQEFNQKLEDFEKTLGGFLYDYEDYKKYAAAYEKSSHLINHAMCRRLSDPFDKFVNAVQGMCSIFEAYNGDILDQHLLWVKAKLEEIESLLGK